MQNKKYAQLIELIINEQEEKARELFHDIVVEKSREIYESMMDEEMMGEEPAGQVMDMLDEINAEEGGMTEAEDDMEFDETDIDLDDGAGDEMDMDAEVDMDDEGDVDAELDVDVDVDGDEGSVDKAELGDLKDKLDDLMAEFESIMAGDDMDMDMEDAADDEEDAEEDMEDAEEDEEAALSEAVKLQRVSVSHGDNGAYTRSPALHEPKVKTAGVKPVKFSGAHETVPTSPKAPSNYGTKGEKELPGAGKFRNVPGGSKAKLEAAPKPKHGDDGSNKKSPVAKG